jgi:3-deoxy-manno-octulosonate cytidylyltransferase (CMP-KDO synthetase)
MVQHVYERVQRTRVERVLVATDDQRIVDAVRAFGGEALLTSTTHASGTDRLAEALARVDADVVVNVQGDEPLIDPAHVDAALAPLLEDATVEMATLATPLLDVSEFLSPDVVKVVSDGRGDALYFSRSAIPSVRVTPSGDAIAAATAAIERRLARRHIGVYVYRRATLLRLAALPPHPLEQAESLEQLRALANGVRIRVVDVAGPIGSAVDTPEDLLRVRAQMARVSPDDALHRGNRCPPSTSS